MLETLLIKVVLLGNSGVGKTNIALKFTEDKFSENAPSTIVVSLKPKTLTFPGGTVFKVNVWDTAGQEKYRSISSMYYRDAQAAILVYDCTYRPSFEALQEWINEINNNSLKENNVILIIAGNKCDLIEKEEVSLEEAKSYAESINALFFMTSAKFGTNIIEMFNAICTKIKPEIKEKINQKVINEGTCKLNSTEKIKKSDCC